MSRYEAVVFDNDGVLTVPTDEELLDRAVATAFAAFGVEPDATQVEAVRADPSPGTVQRVCADREVDSEEFWRRHEIEKAAAQRVALRRGEKHAYADVSALRDLAVPLGIVSNNQHRTVEYVVRECGFDDLFETCYGRHPTLDGMARRKPDPSYLEHAIEDLGTREILYVGDSNVDIEAAAAAGVDSAFVRRPHREGYRLRREPTYRIDGLGELRDIVDGEREREREREQDRDSSNEPEREREEPEEQTEQGTA